MPLQDSIVYSDGGFGYTFVAADGSLVYRSEPPADFDPLTAAPEVLDRYGVPPMATYAAGEAAWRKDYTGWKHDSVYNQCQGTLSAAGSGADDYSRIDPLWGGHIVARTAKDIDWVTGTWTQPNTHPSTCPSNQGMTTWVGLSGDNKLLQAGFNSYGNGNDHHFFYEWVGPNDTGVNQQFDMGHDAYPGTRVKVQVWYDVVKQWFHYDYWDLDTGYQLSAEVNPVKALVSRV